VTPSVTTLLGFVLIVFGIPMIRKWVPPLRIDALPLPGLAMSDEVWYESHRRSGWELVILGVGLIGLAMWSAHSAAASADVRDFLGVFSVVALITAAVRSVAVTVRLMHERDRR
jgi:hypothetical protein